MISFKLLLFACLFLTIQCGQESENLAKNSNTFYLCVHNCALCVRLWEDGLYNGEMCAQKCLKHRSNPKIIDPDCNLLKFFNSKAFRKNVAQF